MLGGLTLCLECLHMGHEILEVEQELVQKFVELEVEEDVDHHQGLILDGKDGFIGGGVAEAPRCPPLLQVLVLFVHLFQVPICGTIQEGQERLHQLDNIVGVGVVAKEDQRLHELQDGHHELVVVGLVLRGHHGVLGVEVGQDPVSQHREEGHGLPAHTEGLILGGLVAFVLLQLVPVINELAIITQIKGEEKWSRQAIF